MLTMFFFEVKMSSGKKIKINRSVSRCVTALLRVSYNVLNNSVSWALWSCPSLLNVL